MISVVNMDISREDFAVVVKESACERVLDIPALPIKIFELLDLGDAHRFAKCCKTAKVPDEYYRLLLIKKVNARFVRREGVELDCADIKLVLVNANESLKRESASAKMSKSRRSPRTATAVNSSSPQAQAQTHDGLFLTLYKYFTYVRQLYDGGIVPSGAHLTFVDCSSVDRSEENPRNMLTESNCLKVIDNLTMNGLTPGLLHQQRIHAQWQCGCLGPRPCYWSSKGSQDVNMVEHCSFDWDSCESIPFELLKSFTVRAYQAHSQPGSPIFAPKRVSIELVWIPCPSLGGLEGDKTKEDTGELERGDWKKKEEKEEEMVYYRETFDVDHSMEPQRFLLATSQMLINVSGVGNTRFRFTFRGAYQRQTLTAEDAAEILDTDEIDGCVFIFIHLGLCLCLLVCVYVYSILSMFYIFCSLYYMNDDVLISQVRTATLTLTLTSATTPLLFTIEITGTTSA